MSTAVDVVGEYIAAWTTGDVGGALARAGDDFALQTAMEVTTGTTALRAALEHFAPLARGARILEQFAAGDRVCTVFELDVALGDRAATVLMAEVDSVSDGRLTHSLLLFDSSSFRGEPQTESGSELVDPVCGMTVDPATAAAVRRVDGREYRFCSTACAERFDREPDRYRHGASA